MTVVMVYDVQEKRCGSALKIARRYLTRVQNSVFEGELTSGKLAALKRELKDSLDLSYDSVMFYTWRENNYASRETMGTAFAAPERFI